MRPRSPFIRASLFILPSRFGTVDHPAVKHRWRFAPPFAERVMDNHDYYGHAKFAALVGSTIQSIEGMEKDSDRVTLTLTDGRKFLLYHSQDCCESVSIQDVVGDPADLIGEPLVRAEVAESEADPEGYKGSDWRESFTWTFYKLATRKGYVDLRWLGESNGYYSESVEFTEDRQ